MNEKATGITSVELDRSSAFDVNDEGNGTVRAILDTHLGRGCVDVPIYWAQVLSVATTTAEIREELGGCLGWQLAEEFATGDFRPL